MNERIPNGTKVYILGKTIGNDFEETKIYEKGQSFGYVRGWHDDYECYVVRWDNGNERVGDYFRPEDISIVLNKGKG